MTDTRWIRTENPDVEQWRQLGQFRYAPNVRRYLSARCLLPAASGIEDYVAGSIGQAEAYFSAARHAPLDISPLLLYYGATSLLSGAAALMRGHPLRIDQHGMAIGQTATVSRISDLEVVVRSTTGSGLQELASVYGVSRSLPGQSKWTLGELLASVPDLKDDVQLCLPEAEPYSLRLDRLQNGHIPFERIALSEFAGRDVNATLSHVAGFRETYLIPQMVKDGVALYRKVTGGQIASEALSGQPVLLVAHVKGTASATPGQVISQLMALFALGTVSRYHPSLWHPFVRTDATGERLLIERFVALVTRWLPNLVLSSIQREWTRFTYEGFKAPHALEMLGEDELRAMIKEIAVGDAQT